MRSWNITSWKYQLIFVVHSGTRTCFVLWQWHARKKKAPAVKWAKNCSNIVFLLGDTAIYIMYLLYHHSVHSLSTKPRRITYDSYLGKVSDSQDYQASKSPATTMHAQHVDINYYSGPRTLSGQNKRDLLCKFYAITRILLPVPVAARSKA